MPEWVWPEKSAKWSQEALLRDVVLIDRWLPYCANRRQCVQAGGNVGVYPAALAGAFEEVWTVEPDAVNFAALSANVPENVHAFRAALGESSGSVGLRTDSLPPLSYYVDGAGSVPVVAIDDWHLSHCDLIALDVEGYEWPALKGAEQTLLRCRPVIVFESDGHWSRYGYTYTRLALWLKERGYAHRATVGLDEVWT